MQPRTIPCPTPTLPSPPQLVLALSTSLEFDALAIQPDAEQLIAQLGAATSTVLSVAQVSATVPPHRLLPVEEEVAFCREAFENMLDAWVCWVRSAVRE